MHAGYPLVKGSMIPTIVAARRIQVALEENGLDIGALLPCIATHESGPVTPVAQSLQLDPGLVWTLAQNTSKPALRAWCRQLTPLAEGIPWHKGYCFACGAIATLGELQENDQAKHLRCGQCGADWLFRRLQCLPSIPGFDKISSRMIML